MLRGDLEKLLPSEISGTRATSQTQEESSQITCAFSGNFITSFLQQYRYSADSADRPNLQAGRRAESSPEHSGEESPSAQPGADQTQNRGSESE